MTFEAKIKKALGKSPYNPKRIMDHLEELKDLAFDTISNLYFEGRIEREEWDSATDKVEECATEEQLANLVRHYENV